MDEVDRKVVILMGSIKDRPEISGIKEVLKDFEIPYEVRALSGHKLASALLEAVENYENLDTRIVYIAVAGRSNALGPLVAGHASSPVINCPVLSSFNEDLYSSLRMPSAVPCSTILEPRNAALHAVKIFALTDPHLAEEFRQWRSDLKDSLLEDDAEVRSAE